VALHEDVGAVLRASIAPTNRAGTVGAVVEAATPGGLRGLAEAAGFHGVGGYVHDALDGVPGVPEEERAQLAAMRTLAALNHLRTVAAIRDVGGVLDGAGVPWLVLKGPTLAGPVHGGPELRWHGDLDVLVPPGRLAQAVALLEREGATMLDRNWTLIHAQRKGEVHLRLPLALELDLHWHLLNDPGLRSSFAVPLGDLFARARNVEVSGTAVPTLGAPETVVYTAMHLMLAGGHRLIWLKDLERLLAARIASVEEIAATARAWRAELLLATAVARMTRVLGPAPGGEELMAPPARRRVWLGIDAAAAKRQPVERQDGWGSLLRILGRSVRATQWASLRELARKAWHHLAERRSVTPDFDPRDPDDPRSDRYDAGGQAARRAFLAEVARAGGDAVEEVRA
jgi:hypothetical protein